MQQHILALIIFCSISYIPARSQLQQVDDVIQSTNYEAARRDSLINYPNNLNIHKGGGNKIVRDRVYGFFTESDSLVQMTSSEKLGHYVDRYTITTHQKERLILRIYTYDGGLVFLEDAAGKIATYLNPGDYGGTFFIDTTFLQGGNYKLYISNQKERQRGFIVLINTLPPLLH